MHASDLSSSGPANLLWLTREISDRGTGYMASLNSATQYTSRPVETVTESGRSRTLQEVLLTLLSDMRGEEASAEASKSESSNTSTSQPTDTLVGCHLEHSPLVKHTQLSLEGIRFSDQGLKTQHDQLFLILQEKDADAGGEATGDIHQAASSAIDETWQVLPTMQGTDLRVNGRPAEALINGIRPDLGAPIAWVYANLHYADFFLYIVVTVRTMS